MDAEYEHGHDPGHCTDHAPGDPRCVRDDLPDADDLMAAAPLLRIPIDTEALGLAHMSPDRRRTVLLAVIASWMEGFQRINEVSHDHLEGDDFRALLVGADRQLTNGDPSIALQVAAMRVTIAGYVVQDIAEDHHADGLSPGAAITDLIRAIIHLMDMWERAHSAPLVLCAPDGGTYAVVDTDSIQYAKEFTASALKGIKLLAGPVPPNAKGKRR